MCACSVRVGGYREGAGGGLGQWRPTKNDVRVECIPPFNKPYVATLAPSKARLWTGSRQAARQTILFQIVEMDKCIHRRKTGRRFLSRTGRERIFSTCERSSQGCKGSIFTRNPAYAQGVFLRNAFASVAEELDEATFTAYDQHVVSRDVHADEKHPIFLIGAFGLGREHGVMTAVGRQEGGCLPAQDSTFFARKRADSCPLFDTSGHFAPLQCTANAVSFHTKDDVTTFDTATPPRQTHK